MTGKRVHIQYKGITGRVLSDTETDDLFTAAFVLLELVRFFRVRYRDRDWKYSPSRLKIVFEEIEEVK